MWSRELFGVVAHKAGLCDMVCFRRGHFRGLRDVWTGPVGLSRRAMSAAVHSPQKFVSLVRTSRLGWRSNVRDGFRSC